MSNVPDSPFKRATAPYPSWLSYGLAGSFLALVVVLTYAGVMLSIGLNYVDTIPCLQEAK